MKLFMVSLAYLCPMACAYVLYAGSPLPAAESSHAKASPFGSWSAQQGYFDYGHSDFNPSRVLTEPGTLKGRWLASGKVSDLSVRRKPEGKDGVDDDFVIQVGAVTWEFESSYGSFTIFGCDIDGDRMDEIVIEDGIGRGTCVYQRRLTILKLFNGGYRSIFNDWLSGYLSNDQDGDPLVWQRNYRFRAVNSKGLDLEFTLVPPERVPQFLDDPDDFTRLQHTRIVMRYYPELKAFRIWEELFVRPTSPMRKSLDPAN